MISEFKTGGKEDGAPSGDYTSRNKVVNSKRDVSSNGTNSYNTGINSSENPAYSINDNSKNNISETDSRGHNTIITNPKNHMSVIIILYGYALDEPDHNMLDLVHERVSNGFDGI